MKKVLGLLCLVLVLSLWGCGGTDKSADPNQSDDSKKEGSQCKADDLSCSSWAHLEDLTLDKDSFWNGADDSKGFKSGKLHFNNVYNAEYKSWHGFAYSNITDITTSGFQNQYSAIKGCGVDAATNYAVGYCNSMDPDNPPTIKLNDDTTPVEIAGAYITNTTYTYLSMKEGDDYAKKFGGADGNDKDWYLLTIEGVDVAGKSIAKKEFYLADFRSEDNSKDYIVKDWTWVDLSSLGKVSGLKFSVTSSDNGDYGMNTPAYFAIDNVMKIKPSGVE